MSGEDTLVQIHQNTNKHFVFIFNYCIIITSINSINTFFFKNSFNCSPITSLEFT